MHGGELCKIYVGFEMIKDRAASLHLLYAPLIGRDALALYELLLMLETRKQKIKNHILIKQVLHCSMEQFEESRKILEQYLLLKTYYQESLDAYIYVLYPPQMGDAFLKNEVFGRLFFRKMGKDMYEFMKLCFASETYDTTGYEEITSPFQDILQMDWDRNDEAGYASIKLNEITKEEALIPISFNYDKFLKGLSTIVFPNEARTKENMELIGQLATIYGISEDMMRKYVSQSIDLKTNKLKKDALKKLVRNANGVVKKIKENSSPYAMSPILFFMNKQNGVKVSNSDKILIERLVSEYKLKPEVVNVLIEYVLKMTNQHFHKAYVEKVATTWVRLHIDTLEKALAQLEYKKEQSKSITGSEWMNEMKPDPNNAPEVSDEEIYALMKQLGGDHT